jgi:hypothetical protein
MRGVRKKDRRCRAEKERGKALMSRSLEDDASTLLVLLAALSSTSDLGLINSMRTRNISIGRQGCIC